MKLLIQNGRVIDPATGFDEIGDVAIAAGRIVSLNGKLADFTPNRTIDATGCIVAPGLIDLSARLREPGHEHERMLESELAAAVAGDVTSLPCVRSPSRRWCITDNPSRPKAASAAPGLPICARRWTTCARADNRKCENWVNE
jgi:hypothetical protein